MAFPFFIFKKEDIYIYMNSIIAFILGLVFGVVSTVFWVVILSANKEDKRFYDEEDYYDDGFEL